MSDTYQLNKKSNMGQTLVCPSCGDRFVKSNNRQAFCGKRGKKNKQGRRTECKDAYWNKKRKSGQPNNWCHPFSGEGLGQF